MPKTPQQMLANWQKGMQGASQAYAQGTAAVQQSPMAAAAAQAGKAAQNYAAAVNSGQWAASLQAVPLSAWKTACANAGPRLASGAAKGANKYVAAMTALAPVHAAMKQAAASAGSDPGMKAAAAINVLVAAGKKGKAANGG